MRLFFKEKKKHKKWCHGERKMRGKEGRKYVFGQTTPLDL